MKLSVDPAQRYAKMRAHTATHLLHAELGQIFPDTKQAGSLVDSDLLRFDFYAERLLSQEELNEIEQHINLMIYQACDVSVQEMSIEEAGKLGAKMFFEEKYGDIVRVVSVNNTEALLSNTPKPPHTYGEIISVELCGGTHVLNTKDIGAFTIISQEAVASGIKRITALTGPRVREKIENQALLLQNLAQTLEVKSIAQLPEKANKILKEYNEVKAKLEAMEVKVMTSTFQTQPYASNSDFDIIMKVPEDLNFKMLSWLAKEQFAGKSVLIGNEQGNFLILAKEGISAKTLAQTSNLKGGGNENQVQGRDLNVLEWRRLCQPGVGCPGGR